MKIVIDIPETVYREFTAGTQSMKNDAIIANAVFDGQPLPKGHGRLIDADALARFIDYGHLNSPDAKMYSENDIRAFVDNAPTIIEADKEGET